jgi:hypothetical protein
MKYDHEKKQLHYILDLAVTGLVHLALQWMYDYCALV